MNKHSPLFRKLNRLACTHGCMNCTALRISRALDEACLALPPGKHRRNNCCGCLDCESRGRHGHDRCRRNH